MTIGAVGVILAPVAAVVGVGAAIFTNVNISIIDHKGETTDINKVTAERLDFFKKKAEKFKKNVEENMDEVEKEVDEFVDNAENKVKEFF